MSRTGLRAFAGLTAGAGAWFSLGALALTDDGVAAGLLPSVWVLPLVAALGVAAAVRVTALPASLAFLPAVAILPWVAGFTRLPVIFLWSGAFVALVWAVMGAAALLSWTARPRWRDAAWPAALVIAAVMTAFALLAWRTPVIGGDEPHYLIIAQSLLLDGDLDLANDYDLARHASFYPGALAHHTVITPDGAEYSFHGIGAGVLAAPAFWIGGLTAVRVWFLGLCAAGAMVFWRAARELTGRPAAAWAAAAALVLHLPFLAQAAAIYPDGPAAAITSFAVLVLIRLERQRPVSPAWLCIGGALLSALPWLHLRLVVIAVAFALAMAWLLLRQRRANDILIFLAIPLIGGALFFAASYVMFQTLDPTAAFRTAAAGSMAAIPRGTFGLLFDLEYGLLVYAPVLALAVAGWRRLHLAAPATSSAGAIAVLGTLATGAAFVWWGGASSPARFLVPVLPLLALSVGAWWTAAGARARGLAAGGMAVGAAIAFLAGWAERGRFLTSNPDGQATIFEWANRLLDIGAAMPSLFRPDASLQWEAAFALVWIASGVVVLGLTRRWGPGWSLVAWVTLAVWLGSVMRGVDPLTPARSQTALLHAAAAPFFATPWLAGRPAAREALLRSLAPDLPLDFVPAGRYRIEVSGIDPAADPAAVLSLVVGRGDHAIAQWPLAARDRAPGLALPVAVETIRVISSAPLGSTRVRLRPLSSLAADRRGALRASYAVRSGDAILFIFDVPQPEDGGFWVFADRPVAVVCAAPDGETPCAGLRFEAGGEPASIALTQGSATQRLQLGARTRAEAPLDAGLEPIQLVATGPPARAAAVFVTAATRP